MQQALLTVSKGNKSYLSAVPHFKKSGLRLTVWAAVLMHTMSLWVLLQLA